MENINYHTYMKTVCDKLRCDLDCDFVGLAFQDTEGPNIRWKIASGNSNDKYERITLRYGKGIAGRVISTGRPMEIKDFPNNIVGKALEYPIILAEKLLYSYAVPILINGIPKGVLLVGSRDGRNINDAEKMIIDRTSLELEKHIHLKNK